MKVSKKIAIGLVVASLSAFGGLAFADTQAARDCIGALNSGRQCCLDNAHKVDLACLLAAPTGSGHNAAVTKCSANFSLTSAICTSHYVDDVAKCRADNP